MRFYKQQHQFYCGVDLHAKTMHVCVVNQAGEGHMRGMKFAVWAGRETG